LREPENPLRRRQTDCAAKPQSFARSKKMTQEEAAQ
jgi:hypothetical protein